jgi:NAD(P)-dependent dehydrogenase (short-subunit alcohol dehydrogenase family)
MDLFSLENKKALVTGAGSGIGQAIALGLADAGADVACFDLPGCPGIQETLDGIAQRGRKAIALFGNVVNLDDMTAAVDATVKTFGSLDLAVNCAGIANAAPAEELPAAQWQKMIDINLTGVFNSCQAEGRAMLKGGKGSIVNIGSMSGVIVNRGLMQVHYNAAKAGVIHLSQSLAMEWIERGVRVNALSPGYIGTPMNTRPEMKDRMREFAESTPIQRIGRPEEMVGPTIFLLSEAASFVTGLNLIADGGFCCW